MKILFWGRGVIGTQYAWALENAGHTVEFYVRKGKKEQYGTSINLEIIDGRRNKKGRLVKEQWPIVTHEEIMETHDYDLIFVSVNPEQLSVAVKYLEPRLGNATVLFFGNFWRDIKKSVEPLPLNQVVWGFPGAGGGIEGNNLYGALYKSVQFGIFGSGPTKRDLELHNLFAEAGFKVNVHKDFQVFLRNHFITNVAMEVEVIKSGSFKKVASSREALVGVSRNTKELILLLKASGTKLDLSARILSSIPSSVFGLFMSMVFTPKGTPYAAMEHNRYQVGPSIREMIAEARKYGIETPRLFAVECLIAE